MLVRQSIYDYYKDGYIDPLYAPYQRKTVLDSNGSLVSINPTSRSGPGANPDLFRKNWKTTFALLYPDDPCPANFEKIENGYCAPLYPEFEPVFYTDKAFIPKTNYEGYTSKVNYNTNNDIFDPFAFRTVSPFDGLYRVSFPSTPVSRRHQSLPTCHSYL